MTTNNAFAQVVQQVLNAWTAQHKAITAFFQQYDDDVYEQAVAPGRNRGIYLLGHLTSAHDGLLPLFGIGERLYPQLETWFSKNPDHTFADIPSIAELREQWNTVNAALIAHFGTMTPEAWLERHNNVSPEDFEKDPLRNKLNVLIGRTTHMSYHTGQLVFLKVAAPVA